MLKGNILSAMDVYNEDVLDLWLALNRYEVWYILVGGFAVNLHKHYRTTADINLYVDDIIQNRDRLGIALEEIKISTKTLVARMQFVAGWFNHTPAKWFSVGYYDEG